ncbi:MAG: hypothetical protein KatS3mg016_0785 [Fimbriimonadales bacterium]|nr:MAG: hypothetical protein KatS3mg016_0785 [Fimbriimonadales bacterium]
MQHSTNTSAVASLVLGIVSLVTLLSVGLFWGCLPLPLVLGIIAWVLGKNAIAQVDAGLGSPSERGMATAGYVMGIIAVALSVLGLCCWSGILVGIIGVGTIPFWAGVQW